MIKNTVKRLHDSELDSLVTKVKQEFQRGMPYESSHNFMIIRYQFSNFIEMLLAKHWHSINSETALESYLDSKVAATIRGFDSKRGSFRKICEISLQQGVRHFLKSRSGNRKKLEYVDKPKEYGASEGTVLTGYDLYKDEVIGDDSLYNYAYGNENNDKFNDWINSIDNERTRFILNYFVFTDCEVSSVDLATILVEKFGGGFEGHLKAIKRLKKKLQQELLDVLRPDFVV